MTQETNLLDKLDEIRSLLASAQTIDVETHPNKERTKKLYWAIEDALTHVKILQGDI